MAKNQPWQRIPTRLSAEEFKQFVLPHLSTGSRGPAPKLSLHAIFNYILRLLYLGCQWKELPIEKDLWRDNLDERRATIKMRMSRQG
jgi:transposase